MSLRSSILTTITISSLLISGSSYAFMDWLFGSSITLDSETMNGLKYEDLSGSKNKLDPSVFNLGLKAYSCATKRGYQTKPVFTIIDYSKPSSEPRMFIIDLAHKKVKYQELVAHGKNSGDLVPKHFSNSANSLESSIGLYKTAFTYYGKNGYSLRLQGLEAGYNTNAMSRAVVIHGADYVNEDLVRKYGEIGRSWGCPAVSKDMLKPTINSIKGGTLVFAYYPDRSWLRESSFLHC
ncbi:MAG: murein L,D-transpeptidase catalytic domain family protein [Legionellales bacterium]|nr:murein L,D-transpeptidase catalytic domain family protein [Legionellales bacterium]